MILGTGCAAITLPMSTQIIIEDALLYPDSTRTLLSYRDIRNNGLRVETHEEEYFLLTKNSGCGKQILERIPHFSFGLYYTYIKPVTHVVYKIIFHNVDTFQIWHDRLGHPGVGMIRKIIKNAIGHNLNEAKFPQSSDFVCTACSTRKLILRPSYLKVKAEPFKFLERIHSGRYMWSYTTIICIIQVFYGFNRCIYKMVSCVSFISPKPCFC
jgi:hypothetical protein